MRLASAIRLTIEGPSREGPSVYLARCAPSVDEEAPEAWHGRRRRDGRVEVRGALRYGECRTEEQPVVVRDDLAPIPHVRRVQPRVVAEGCASVRRRPPEREVRAPVAVVV